MSTKINLTFTEGILATFQADSIVNSTNQELRIDLGYISKSILKEAGGELQIELKQRHPQPISYGEVAITGGYKLKCKKVFHVALPAWDIPYLTPPQVKEVLCQTVCNCLKEANNAGLTSIAFPTLGCGFLNYPLDVVTETMCQCIAKFEANTKQSTLKNAYIIIYNKGSDWKHIKQAFLQTQTRSNENRKQISKHVTDFLSTCQRESMSNSCGKTLACGHACLGYKNEKTCPPCLNETCKTKNAGHVQHNDDDCAICYTDHLEAAPVAVLKCGHAFHLHCTKRVLANKWVGPRLVFNFMLCPLCKEPIDHPELNQKIAPMKALHDEVKRKAVMRLGYEKLDQSEPIKTRGSPYYEKPEAYAMDRYAYYQCFRCKKAYFGGLVQCEAGAQGQEEHDFKVEDLICPSCSGPKDAGPCATHGDEFLEYKCRYCCSVAVYFCMGTTHFCDKCHSRFYAPKPLPKCPAGPGGQQLVGRCPLRVKHPPTGEEFCLGCGLCSNMNTF